MKVIVWQWITAFQSLLCTPAALRATPRASVLGSSTFFAWSDAPFLNSWCVVDVLNPWAHVISRQGTRCIIIARTLHAKSETIAASYPCLVTLNLYENTINKDQLRFFVCKQGLSWSRLSAYLSRPTNYTACNSLVSFVQEEAGRWSNQVVILSISSGQPSVACNCSLYYSITEWLLRWI